MSNKLTCKECGKNFKMLTKEWICAFCYLRKFKQWSKDFMAGDEKKK